jgi:hypothetical protein
MVSARPGSGVLNAARYDPGVKGVVERPREYRPRDGSLAACRKEPNREGRHRTATQTAPSERAPRSRQMILPVAVLADQALKSDVDSETRGRME